MARHPGQLLDEAPGQPRRDLTELDALRFAPGEKAPHGTGIGAAGVGGLEILAAKNSSAAKQAARCKMAGKASARAEVWGTSTFIEPARSYN